jgi:hypothetical protein
MLTAGAEGPTWLSPALGGAAVCASTVIRLPSHPHLTDQARHPRAVNNFWPAGEGDPTRTVSTRPPRTGSKRFSRPIAGFIERNGAMYPLSLVRPG